MKVARGWAGGREERENSRLQKDKKRAFNSMKNNKKENMSKY